MARTILVVDDEQNLLDLLTRSLGKRGFSVQIAASGPEAMKLLDERSFDLALVDIRMMPMSGIDLLERIKRSHPATQAIMMTGYPTSETRELALEKGACAYLTKPLDIQDLVQRLNSLIPP